MKKGLLPALMILGGGHAMPAQSLCTEIHGSTLSETAFISRNNSTEQLPKSENKQYNAVESIRSEMIESMTVEEQATPVSVMTVRSYAVPKMEFSRAKGPNLLQTLGYIAVGVTRVLVFPSASEHPDL